MPTNTLTSQRGAMSPFMFGLLAGMAVFSVASTQWASQELARVQAAKREKEKAQAEDIAKAIEFTLLTETAGTYTNNPDRTRIMANTSMATGKTVGDEDVLMVQRQVEDETFGARTDRVAITASDDTLLRSKVFRSGSAEELSQLPTDDNSVVTVDTAAIRQRQVAHSAQNMEALAEYIYAFYAGNMKWPNPSEFEDIADRARLTDVWGQPFIYTLVGDDGAVLELNTPWNYTHTLKLSLKDDTTSAKTESNETTTNAPVAQ